MDSNILEEVVCMAGAQIVGMIAQSLEADSRQEVNQFLRQRNEKGRFAKDFDDLAANEKNFKENFHMDMFSFNALFELVEPYLQPKKRTRPKDEISPKQKLAVVLEYFACGTLQRHIASVYRISKQHFGVILLEVCDAITSALCNEIPPLTPTEIRRTGHTFNKWNFPNCGGAIDGKHVAIKCPANSGSLFYNYKGFFSLVLMAAADGDYRFTYLDIGAYGNEGDAGVFQKCTLGKAVLGGTLAFPEAVEHPYVFVADDAFPLHVRIMKPFVPSRNRRLDEDHRIFNYRLSRARRCIENAFGILCSKFYCLSRKMFCSPKTAQKVVTACCYLHNFLIRTRRSQYCPSNYGDEYNEFGEVLEGEFRRHIPANSLFLSEVRCAQTGRLSQSASSVRENLSAYFNSDEGSIAWQRRAACLD